MRGAWARGQQAKLMSCFCPVDRGGASFLHGLLELKGSVRMKSPTLTSSQASSTCSSVIQDEPRRTLSAMVPVKRKRVLEDGSRSGGGEW